MAGFKPSYRRNLAQHIRARITKRGVALKRPLRTTFKARAAMTKAPAFGQKSYTYGQLRTAKKQLGLK